MSKKFDRKLNFKWHQSVIKIQALGVQGCIFWDCVLFWKDMFFDELWGWQKVALKSENMFKRASKKRDAQVLVEVGGRGGVLGRRKRRDYWELLIAFSIVWVCVCLVFCVFVGLWACGFGLVGCCVYVFACLCSFARFVFCVIVCDCMFVNLSVC